jgi:hypothetical protein
MAFIGLVLVFFIIYTLELKKSWLPYRCLTCKIYGFKKLEKRNSYISAKRMSFIKVSEVEEKERTVIKFTEKWVLPSIYCLLVLTYVIYFWP